MDNVFNHTIAVLSEAGVSSPRLEARIMLSNVLEKDEGTITSDTVLDEHQQQKLDKMLALRLKDMPLDKIIGTKDFYKYRFNVTCDVLSPRPDTEVLVEEALCLASDFQTPCFLDLGTGSGCILLSLL